MKIFDKKDGGKVYYLGHFKIPKYNFKVIFFRNTFDKDEYWEDEKGIENGLSEKKSKM